MVADVGDRPDRDDLPGGGRTAPADAADDAVALGDLDQQRARRLGHVRVGGVPDDRRERAVDVEQHRRAGGFGAERLERLHERGSGGHRHKYGARARRLFPPARLASPSDRDRGTVEKMIRMAPRRRRLVVMGLDNPIHIVFIVVILLLVFGAKRLPEIGRSLGSGMREFKDSVSGTQRAAPSSSRR